MSNKKQYNDNFSIVMWYKERRNKMNDIQAVVSSHGEVITKLVRKL